MVGWTAFDTGSLVVVSISGFLSHSGELITACIIPLILRASWVVFFGSGGWRRSERGVGPGGLEGRSGCLSYAYILLLSLHASQHVWRSSKQPSTSVPLGVYVQHARTLSGAVTLTGLSVVVMTTPKDGTNSRINLVSSWSICFHGTLEHSGGSLSRESETGWNT